MARTKKSNQKKRTTAELQLRKFTADTKDDALNVVLSNPQSESDDESAQSREEHAIANDEDAVVPNRAPD